MYRVELVSIWFARLANRKQTLHSVIRPLEPETQVSICHRLGYYNVFRRSSPSMFYRMRMWRTDEYRIAHVLYKIASNSSEQCFRHFAIDGKTAKVTKGPGAARSVPELVPVLREFANAGWQLDSECMSASAPWAQPAAAVAERRTCRYVANHARLCGGGRVADLHLRHRLCASRHRARAVGGDDRAGSVATLARAHGAAASHSRASQRGRAVRLELPRIAAAIALPYAARAAQPRCVAAWWQAAQPRWPPFWDRVQEHRA